MASLINRRLLWIIFFILVLTIFCPFTYSKIIYVDDDATGANDGTNWTEAYVFLQDALADANDSDRPVEIRVAQGIYKPDQGAGITPGDREATFQLINGVTLSGGYAGIDANDPDTRDIEMYETILSGDLNGDDEPVDDLQTLYYEITRYDNSYSVVTAEYTDETAVLDGVTLTAGMANIHTSSSGNQQHGGGFYCYEAHPVIDNCTFKLNVARQGAGIYIYGGEPSIINCRFVNNVSICDSPERGRGCYGSGLYNIYGKPVLTSCEFIENYGDYGAGISIHRSNNVTITNCSFKQNRASSKGGGMHCEDNNDLAIINCRFIENYNSGRYDSGDGGAIYIITGDYLLTDCIFKNNSTENSGGAISNSDAHVNIKNCLFAGNSAGNAGGAISLEESSIGEICNCTIAHNRATKGGGLYVVGSGTRVNITNSIIWGNSEWMYINRSGLSINYSCVPALFYPRPGAQITNIMAEPLFAEPGYWADSSDPNVIVELDYPNAVWVDGDYHLKSQAGRWDPNSGSWVIDDITSPCIDAGDPNMPVGDETEPNGGIINMGAYGGTAEASKSKDDTTSLSVAYVYYDDLNAAQSFQSLLESNGYPTTIIKTDDEIESFWGCWDLVIVANDTNYQINREHPNNLDRPNILNSIKSLEKPFIGLGEGGYDFFGRLNLSIGSPNGARSSFKDITVIDPNCSLFSTPYKIDIPQDGTVQLYTEADDIAIYLWPDIPDSIAAVATESGNLGYYSLAMEDNQYFLWGFTESPEKMTETGRKLFINTVIWTAYMYNSRQVNVDDDDNGSQVTIEQRQTLVVTLVSNIPPRYHWEVVKDPNSILEQAGGARFLPSDPFVYSPGGGPPGWDIYRFKAISAGQQTLNMVYRHYWETNAEHAKTFSIDVIVN